MGHVLIGLYFFLIAFFEGLRSFSVVWACSGVWKTLFWPLMMRSVMPSGFFSWMRPCTGELRGLNPVGHLDLMNSYLSLSKSYLS